LFASAEFGSPLVVLFYNFFTETGLHLITRRHPMRRCFKRENKTARAGEFTVTKLIPNELSAATTKRNL
jgi:hypothetical protein